MQARIQEETVLTERADAAYSAASTHGAAPSASGPQRERSDALLSLILTSLEDDKAEDVVTIDLSGKSEMADHMIVASGRSSRQVGAIAEKLVDRIKAATGTVPRTEGKDTGDWVLIDCGDAVVHVFRPEVREFYQLEKMWLSPEEQRRRTADAAPQDA